MDFSSLVGPIIVTLITAISTSGIIALIFQRKRTAAEVGRIEQEAEKLEAETQKLRDESADIIRNASKDLIMQYQLRVKELETIVRELNEKIAELRDDLNIANIEIKRLNELLRIANKKLNSL